MKPAPFSPIWPPAPAPPWVGSPLTDESINNSVIFAFVIALVFLLIMLIILWPLLTKTGSVLLMPRDDRRNELWVRHKLLPMFGKDARWLTSAELEKRLELADLRPDEAEQLIHQLARLEEKRYRK